MKINIKKTKVMRTSRLDGKEVKVEMEGEQLEQEGPKIFQELEQYKKQTMENARWK